MSLLTLGEAHGTDKVAHGYLPIYERHLAGRSVSSVLEIGVWNGKSLRMWAEFFPEAQIYGLDINPDCRRHETDRIHVVTGSQDDPTVLASLVDEADGFDVVVDDGSHVNELTIASFDALWPHARQVYVIEDLLNSYKDLTPHVDDWPGMQFNRDLDYRNDRGDIDQLFTERIRAVDREGGSAHFYKWLAVFER